MDCRSERPDTECGPSALINPGDPGLLASSPQHSPLCLHTLISLVSVQRTGISQSVHLILYLPIAPSQKPEILLESAREIRGSESANS